MLYHIPVLLIAAGMHFWACCCGWVPMPGDSSLAVHLKRQAVIGKMERATYDDRVVHYSVVHLGRYRTDWCRMPPDHEELLAALRMGDWPTVAARLDEVEKYGPAHRDS